MSSKIIGKPHAAWEAWHRAIEASLCGNDEVALSELNNLLSEKVVFKAPTYFKEQASKEYTMLALQGVGKLFKDFQYTREFIGERDMALEFVCKCGPNGPLLHGIDMMKLDENGQIVELAVLARPPSAVAALYEHQKAFFKKAKM